MPRGDTVEGWDYHQWCTGKNRVSLYTTNVSIDLESRWKSAAWPGNKRQRQLAR